MNLRVFAIVSALMVLVAGCGNQGASSTGPVTIAMTTWLSGSYASFGAGLKLGAELAAKQLNDQGGIVGGRQVKLAFYDEGYNADTISASAKNAVNDGAAVIVGGWDATTCPALAQQGKTAKVAIVITSCGSDDPEGIGHPALVATTPPYTSHEYANNVESINVQFWLKKGGIKSAVGVAGDSAFSVTFDSEIKKAVAGTGIKWLGNIYFPYGQSDAKIELTKAAGMKPDLIYLQMGGHDAIVNSILTLRELAYPGVIMSNTLSTTDAELKTLGSKGDGIYTSTFWVADPSIPASVKFQSEFKAANNGTEPDAFTEEAYESVMIAGLALNKAGSTSDLTKIHDAFHSLDWVTPRGSKATFDSKGRMLFDSYYILMGSGGHLVLADSVPFTYGR